jgi:hypothetical protein
MSSGMTPAEMTPDERLREIASHLARGILRLRRRCGAVSAGSGDIFSDSRESCPQGLELSGDPWLSFPRG